jgi:hypothetical protein
MNKELVQIKILKWYCIAIGILIIVSWIFILFTKSELPEGNIELAFHLISEFIMAFACLFGGVLIHRKKKTGYLIVLIGFGMLIYSTLNAGGYYLEHGDYAVPLLMLLLFLTTLMLAFLLIKILSNENK